MDDMLIELFREDAAGQLEALDTAMVEAEGAADPVDALTRCMRAAHSLKGAARVVGLDTIVAVAHAMEDGFEAKTDGAQQVKPKAKFRAALAGSAPTGMAGITRPFKMTRIMTQSTVAF